MADPLGQLRLRFSGLRLLRDGDDLRTYAGKDFSGHDVTVAVLSERAAADVELRRRFTEAIQRHSGAKLLRSDTRAARPWAAARNPDGLIIVDRIAAELAGDSSPEIDRSITESRPAPPPAQSRPEPPEPRPRRAPLSPAQRANLRTEANAVAFALVGFVLLALLCVAVLGALD